MLVTRFAPTPSGYLHVGNAVNALLTAWLARSTSDGRLLLRIDDFDAPRLRPEYLADVFDTLAWLGIVPDEGPRDAADFVRRWSMSARLPLFAAARDRLLGGHPDRVFVCRCSRRGLTADGRCGSGCREAALAYAPGLTVVRLAVPDGVAVRIGAAAVAVPSGDHVLWRRDDLPAYQLGSVLMDEALGVTAVVRGTDLLESSAMQLQLAELLPAPGFRRADLRHHALLRDATGRKLSKSAGAHAHPMARSEQLRDQVTAWAIELGGPIGIAPRA